MRLSHHIERAPHRKRDSESRSKPAKASVATHGSFIPMVTIWGAALLGLIVIVLPSASIDRTSALAGWMADSQTARFAYAGIAAVLGGGFAFFVAGALRSKAVRNLATGSIVSVVNARRVQPINPASDLGSDSLDAPIEDTPYEEAPEESPEEFEAEQRANADVSTDEDEDKDLDAEWEEAWDLPVGNAQPERGPTLGELSQRGYEMEAPDNAIDGDEGSEADDFSFKHKQFQRALIETCAAESCEGASCEAASEGRENAAESAQPEAQSPQTNEIANSPIVAKPRKSEDQPKIGGGGRNASWSLTQFAPDGEANKADLAPEAPAAREDSVTADKTPDALDLGAYTQEPAPPATAPAPIEPPVPASALAKLREKPTDKLSLAEMVERFAGALHEHQAHERKQAAKGQPSGRDAALAEALKALTLFTEQGFDGAQSTGGESQLNQTERDLRAALAKLHDLRGAA